MAAVVPADVGHDSDDDDNNNREEGVTAASVRLRRAWATLCGVGSGRRLSVRLLSLAIQHDFRHRLRRGFTALKAPVVGAAAVSALERRLEEARAWHRGRVRATAFGLWLTSVQETRDVDQVALAKGHALHRQKALRGCCRRWRAHGAAAGLARRRAALSACYLATLRAFEGLTSLREGCAARAAHRHDAQACLTQAASWRGRRQLATALRAWRRALMAARHVHRQVALASGHRRQRSVVAAVDRWGAAAAARGAGAARLAAAATHRRRRDLAASLAGWRRVTAVHWRIGRSARAAADRHHAFVGVYRCCVRVMVRLVSLMKRTLLTKRRDAAGAAAHRRRLLTDALTRAVAFHRQARGHAAVALRADFHRDMRRLARHFAALRGHRDGACRARHGTVKGVLIWKMARLLTGLTRWLRWVRRKVARRHMRAAAEAGHAQEVARRACRVVLAAYATNGARHRDERRKRLVLTTLARWRRFVLRRQLAREMARQRGTLAAAGVTAPGRPPPAATAAAAVRPQERGPAVPGDARGEGGEGLGDLARARPRPLAPFLVFRRGGGGGVGGGLTCALGVVPAAGAAVAAVVSSPVSVAGSSRILSPPGGRHGGGEGNPPPQPAPAPAAPSGPAGRPSERSASVVWGAAASRPPPARAPAGEPGTAAAATTYVGLARAPPRKPPALGALLDGIGILPPPRPPAGGHTEPSQ